MEAVGFDGINFIHQFMEVVPQQYVLDSMRLFAEEVMPQFQGRPEEPATRRGGALMPLAGSLDIRSLLEDAPNVTLSDRELHLDDVDILQVLYEIGFTDLESLVPPALKSDHPARRHLPGLPGA